MNTRIEKYLWPFVIVVFVLVGCKKENNPVSSDLVQDSSSVKDSIVVDNFFVIDSMKLNANVKYDYLTDSVITIVSVILACHFIEMSGTVDGISMSVINYGRVLILEPPAPIPAGRQLLYDPDFRFWDTFTGQDSIFIRLGIGGRFWEKKDSLTTYYGQFSYKDSMWVQLQR